MTFASDNYYARWRARIPTRALREGNDTTPPEHLLQAIWLQQRLLRGQLETLDGQPVRLLHPGFKNHEAGPDFRGAVIQFGSSPPRSGDVEIDLQPGGWRAHGHDRNPNFKNVILHVIWEGGSPAAGGIPTLPLRGKLDASLEELASWLGRESLDSLPGNLQGQCSAPLAGLSPAALQDLLCQAAWVRFQGKAAQLQARARQVGWEQSLWEGLFRALGYKNNVWPMQCLAESRGRWHAPSASALACQARLLGISGLLPAELSRAQTAADGYVRRIWDQWWRERDQFGDCSLPRGVWRFNNLRPANHPQRRLALAAHWLAAGDLVSKLEKWFSANLSEDEFAAALLETLQAGRDEFWSWHWTIRSARLAEPQPLLGAARVTDLAVNVILPWCWVRAVEGENEKLRKQAEHRYLAWPAAEDNRVLKLARQRLLGGASPKTMKNAAAQQGLLQILRDFCDHSNALCDNCRFPELVRNFGSKRG